MEFLSKYSQVEVGADGVLDHYKLCTPDLKAETHA